MLAHKRDHRSKAGKYVHPVAVRADLHRDIAREFHLLKHSRQTRGRNQPNQSSAFIADDSSVALVDEYHKAAATLRISVRRMRNNCCDRFAH